MHDMLPAVCALQASSTKDWSSTPTFAEHETCVLYIMPYVRFALHKSMAIKAEYCGARKMFDVILYAQCGRVEPHKSLVNNADFCGARKPCDVHPAVCVLRAPQKSGRPTPTFVEHEIMWCTSWRVRVALHKGRAVHADFCGARKMCGVHPGVCGFLAPQKSGRPRRLLWSMKNV